MKEFEIKVENVRLRANHGVFDFERTQGNDFEVSLRVSYPAPSSEILGQDALENTVCYDALYKLIREEMATPRNLLETVAAGIAGRIRISFPFVSAIECEICKLNPPIEDFNGKVKVCYKELIHPGK